MWTSQGATHAAVIVVFLEVSGSACLHACRGSDLLSTIARPLYRGLPQPPMASTASIQAGSITLDSQDMLEQLIMGKRWPKNHTSMSTFETYRETRAEVLRTFSWIHNVFGDGLFLSAKGLFTSYCGETLDLLLLGLPIILYPMLSAVGAWTKCLH